MGARQAVTAMLVTLVLLLLHHPASAQKGKDADAPDGIQCYTCGLETVDPHLDKPGSYSVRVYKSTAKVTTQYKMYNHSCDEMDRKEGQDVPVRLTSDDFTSVKLNTAIKEASGGQYDLTGDGFEIYEEDFILLREKVPDLPEWGKSQ